MADEIYVEDLKTGVRRMVTRRAYMAMGPTVYRKLHPEEIAALESQVSETETTINPPDNPPPSVDEEKSETKTNESPATENAPAPKKRGRPGKSKTISSDDAEEK